MAAFTFKLGSLDLAPYLQTQKTEGLDPTAFAFAEPKFSQSPLREGGALVYTAVSNKEMVWPLMLNAATKDALYALERSITVEIAKPGVSVEWRDAGASRSTFYDVEAGRVEPDFDYWRGTKNWLKVTLRLWCAPYGHTGMDRLVASGAGTGVVLSVGLATALEGNIGAPADVQIGSGSTVPSGGRFVAFAVLPHPSYLAEVPAADTVGRMAGATLKSASGAARGEFLALPVSPTSPAVSAAAQVRLPEPSQYIGQNRVLGMLRSGFSGGVAVRAFGPEGHPLGPTAVASARSGWGLVDLGVLAVPSVLVRPVDFRVSLHAGGLRNASGGAPSVVSSPAFQLTSVVVLPEGAAFVADRTSPNPPLPRDIYRLESSIEEVWRQQSGGDLTARLTGQMRGALPVLPAPTAPRVAALVAPAVEGPADGVLDVSVTVRERYTFAR